MVKCTTKSLRIRERRKIVELYDYNRRRFRVKKTKNIVKIANRLLHCPKTVRKYVNISAPTASLLSL